MLLHTPARSTPLMPRRIRRDGASRRPGTRLSSSSSGTSVPAPPQPRVLRRAPASIAEVDNGKILGFGADLAPDHPGFGDAAYTARRVEIAGVARQHAVGEPIPRISYTPAEVAVWGTALAKLKALFPLHACAEYNKAFAMFGFREDEVPQLQDVSDALERATGWQVRPVAGLMHPRDFLNGLAFKTFHSTMYIRHPSQPHYTPEPDVVHELIGHVPLLADPLFAAMVEAIGRASLGADDDKLVWHLTKVYWHTVEFGVVREGGAVKAFGAGILSSYGELEHMGRGAAEVAAFDPFQPQPRMSYKDGYQRLYYALDSFEAGLKLMQDYTDSVVSASSAVL